MTCLRGRLFATAILLTFTSAVLADRVHRRGGAESIDGKIDVVSDAGVSIVREDGVSIVVAWDRVRAVDTGRVVPEMERSLERGRDIWRARTRVERHDYAMAEPLFERWAGAALGQTNETALVLAEGLLRCRLARGDHARAIVPFLETLRLRRLEVETQSYSAMARVMDEAYELVPALAPFFYRAPAIPGVLEVLASYDAGDDEVVGACRDLYRAALLSAVAQAPEGAPATRGAGPDHAGVTLLDAVQRASLPGESGDDARRQLRRLREDAPVWASAWIDLSRGIGLLRTARTTDNDGVRTRGLVALAHVPARHGDDMAYLTGLALAWMVAAAEDAGDAAMASRLRVELERVAPRHPLFQVEPPVTLDFPDRTSE